MWNLGGSETDIKRSELTKSVKDHQNIYNELEKEKAIVIIHKGRSVFIHLTDQGLQILNSCLQDPSFYLPSGVVGTKSFNALLKWNRQNNLTISKFNGNSNGKKQEQVIESYEEFKTVALKVYQQLNQDYNLDDLVPIYRMRREISEQVSRSQFNEWLLEMQADGLIQLIGGEMTNITPDKVEDSIKTELGAMRYYAKLLNF